MTATAAQMDDPFPATASGRALRTDGARSVRQTVRCTRRWVAMATVLVCIAVLAACRPQAQSSAEDRADFAARYAAAWSGQDPVAFGAFYEENGTVVVNGAASVGREAIVETARSYMTAFPDMRVRLDSLGQQGDTTVFHWTWTGTNTGPGGTGNAVRLSGYERWTFGSNGLIQQSDGHFDDAEYQRQVNGSGEAAVPVYREPRHRLVLDSTRFRVMDVLIEPGDTTGFHVHDTPMLFVSLQVAPTKGQVQGTEWPTEPASPPFARIGDVTVDSTYATEPMTHRVTNDGESAFRLLGIASAGPSSASGCTEAAALPGTREIESTWFQQSRVSVAEGANTDWFVADCPLLIVQPLASRLAVTFGEGQQRLDGAGGWLLVPPRTRYRLLNEGPAPATAVTIAIR